jgi:serpin B
MMNQTECFNYMEGESYKAIELPYDGDEIAMVILVPDAGTFETFEENLDLTLVSSIIGNLSSTNINLKMPEWEFDSDFSLSGALKGMGMTDAFINDIADFSGIDGTQFLFISDVVHKAFVLVNESGTEAAAATGVIFGFIWVPPPPIDFTINRPFIFFIRDIETDTILFIGRVLNPEE